MNTQHTQWRTVLLTVILNMFATFAYCDNDKFTPSKYDAELRAIKLPLIEIVTTNGLDPTGTNIFAPDDLWGIGLIDNEYVQGQMRMTLNDKVLYDSGADGMKIRLRGNSSSYYRHKKPYKIKLSKKQDLLFRNNPKYTDKEWVLLRLQEGASIRFLTGYLTGTLLNLGWQPQWEFVNLVINGDYKGDYILIEGINRATGRINIDKSGYIIEDDAYWWNEALYFKGNILTYKTGFTFKYPEDDDVDDRILSNIKWFIQAFEETLSAGGDISPYINIDSFAAWLLAWDILGQGDSAGTNRYLIKQNYNSNNPTSTQLYMGPLWDFDAIFRTPNNWCAMHDRSYSFYFPNLLKRQDFYTSYVNQWKEVHKTLREDIIERLRSFYDEKGEALDASRLLDNKRWYTNVPFQSLASEIEETDEWLKTQTEFIDTQLLTRYQLQFVVDGEVLYTDSLIYRESITYPDVPHREGFTFKGWDTDINTMPAKDLTISGSYTNTVSIDNIEEEKAEESFIDIAGRRHRELKKTYRGIYIINGKKTFVR